ncbi:hypothetical protein GCM10010289_54690 [Streptomyces violascens]|uniref:4Fe-4S Wbl-type domain-containing protein n=1 Tax=Streptomyces violascens TaxID=67381 RepID=A0ABQ3QV94_9ACTN|nr:hypothetical protein GCM10010289_54690 [Streptomyces violascens]GHI41206.1 hypothetical protein Sviol_56140 [Streptomyces violascens]
MITPTTSAAWTENAPCAGLDGYIPDESLVRSDGKLLAACGSLMQDCANRCPFAVRCYDLVRPKESRFDGVCAARIWVNGKQVAAAEGAPPLPRLRTRAGSCGTSSGVAGHRRLDEPLCGECRVTAQRAEVRRAGAASIRKRSTRKRLPAVPAGLVAAGS